VLFRSSFGFQFHRGAVVVDSRDPRPRIAKSRVGKTGNGQTPLVREFWFAAHFCQNWVQDAANSAVDVKTESSKANADLVGRDPSSTRQ
jgi:hypothetical protein